MIAARWIGWLGAVGLLAAETAVGQVIERGVTATGPAGRTIEREIKRERAPGERTRELTIQRPAGTLQREVTIQRAQPLRGGPPARAAAPPARTNVLIERNIFVPSARSPLVRTTPFFSFFFNASPLLPPPVMVVPQPAVVVPPPVVVSPPPVVVAATRPVFDPYADALGRLSSRHDNSRRDGALTLGRLGDSRAVPALIDLLQSDPEAEVRAAAAQSLGSLGDSRARSALEQAALHDRKREVRQAAAHSYARLPLPDAEPNPAPPPPPSELLPVAAPAPDGPRNPE